MGFWSFLNCINKYKKLYLQEREKYLIAKEKNARLQAQILRAEVLLNKCGDLLDQLQKVKSVK